MYKRQVLGVLRVQREQQVNEYTSIRSITDTHVTTVQYGKEYFEYTSMESFFGAEYFILRKETKLFLINEKKIILMLYLSLIHI